MADRLDGKVALITGGARGQGKHEAHLFADEGATVVITDVLDREGEATAAAIERCAYLQLDVASEDQWTATVAELLERHGRLDVLVNNAGIYLNQVMVQTSLEDYRRVIDINQVGVFLGMKAVAPGMTAAGSGSIINISSGAGLRGRPGRIAYAASKWAVRGMTKVAARELAPFGVRVNSIHPGPIDTAMLHQDPDVTSDIDRVIADVPLGRFGEPQEVAKLALFLASEDSSYSTGSEFLIDGGTTA